MKRKLLTLYGPEFSKEERGSAGLCSSKVSKSLQRDFASQLPVTSGHCACTVWQKYGHDAGPMRINAPSPVVSMSKWTSGCYASCRGKNLSCGTTHSTDCTYKSRGILVGDVPIVAAIANDESLHVRVRKVHPPEGRSSQHPLAPGGAKKGVSSNSVKCCVIAKSGLLRARPV